jgi:hypothetical protein
LGGQDEDAWNVDGPLLSRSLILTWILLLLTLELPLPLVLDLSLGGWFARALPSNGFHLLHRTQKV